MNAALEQIEQLQIRLRALELRIVTDTERPIVEVARRALREEITTLSQRLNRRDYWRPRQIQRTA